MIMVFRRFRGLTIALLAAGAVTSCSQLPSSQQPVQSSNPSVTYNYRTDQELLQANQNATTYCNQYQTAPRTANITNNPDGSKAVVFECVRTTLPVPPPTTPTTPSQSYTYRTDQELVQASQTAGAYCLKYGSQPMTSSIVSNPNGTKTVTFQCGLR
jgi:exopolysaccharide biosynthesis predicted pyruvyltransferase EpsI